MFRSLVFVTIFVMLVGGVSAATVSGKVWEDINTDGVINGSELGLGSVTIVANEVGTSTCISTTTDASGNYSLTTNDGGNRTYRIYEADGWTAADACPPTESVYNHGIPPNHVTLGTIKDPTGYVSSTSNVREVSYTGSGGATDQNFGDYQRDSFDVCEGAGLLVQQTDAELWSVNLDTGEASKLDDQLDDDPGVTNAKINAVGYNVLDDFVYGWDQTTKDSIKRIGLETGSNPTNYIADTLNPGVFSDSLIVGDVSVDGYLYATNSGINADPGTTQVYKIDVNFQRPTFLTVVDNINNIDLSDLGTLNDTVQDWGFNPADGKLYMVSKNEGHLLQLDLSAANPVVNDLGVIYADGKSIKDPSVGNDLGFGAVYFDRSGFFYFANNTTGYIYRMNLTNVPNSIPTGGTDTSTPGVQTILLVTNYSFGPDSSQNDGARCFLAEGPAQDWGDAPIQGSDANGVFAFGTAHHNVKDTSTTLKIGTVDVDSEADAFYDSDTVSTDTDEHTGTNDESGEGVALRRQALTPGGTFTVDVTVTNTTGSAAYVTGYIDWRVSGTSNAFDTIDTTTNTYVVDAGEQSDTQSIPSGGTATVTLTWTIPAGFSVTGDFTSYLRLRLSTNQAQTQLARGGAADGEVEDYKIIIGPTAVRIGKVELKAVAVTDFLNELGVAIMDSQALQELLATWDEDAAAALADADRNSLLRALQTFLDPDGDGQVAVLSWETLEERGTIGFYVQRQLGEGHWVSLNGQKMLPGLITAPMGGEYQLADPSAYGSQTYRYQLIEQEARGTRRTYGPYLLKMR